MSIFDQDLRSMIDSYMLAQSLGGEFLQINVIYIKKLLAPSSSSEFSNDTTRYADFLSLWGIAEQILISKLMLKVRQNTVCAEWEARVLYRRTSVIGDTGLQDIKNWREDDFFEKLCDFAERLNISALLMIESEN